MRQRARRPRGGAGRRAVGGALRTSAMRRTMPPINPALIQGSLVLYNHLQIVSPGASKGDFTKRPRPCEIGRGGRSWDLKNTKISRGLRGINFKGCVCEQDQESRPPSSIQEVGAQETRARGPGGIAQERCLVSEGVPVGRNQDRAAITAPSAVYSRATRRLSHRLMADLRLPRIDARLHD